MANKLKLTEQQYLLLLARQSISKTITGSPIKHNTQLDEQLHYLAATFVTLTIAGELRGCIGSLVARRNLVEDVIQAAKSAAFSDPRFRPITAAELSSIDIEISILSAAKAVEFDSEQQLFELIRPDIDGVIIEQGSNRATFLPQVWQQLPKPEQFFSQLKLKAGLPASTPLSQLQVSRYQVQEFSDYLHS